MGRADVGTSPAIADRCVPNIGTRGQIRRLTIGALSLVAAVGVAAWLVKSGAPRPWRLVLLPLFVAAMTGILQAREKT